MNKFRIIILVFLCLGIFQIVLFSTITSRVEGTILSDETGEPIEGAEVVLSKTFAPSLANGFGYDFVGKRITDKKGYFKFDQIETGEESKFFLATFKDGYGSHGPFILRGQYEGCKGIGCNLPNDLQTGAIDKGLIEQSEIDLKTFYLQQGQIKYFVIHLKKEATLEVKIYRKIPKGIELMPDIGKIYLYHSQYYTMREIRNSNPYFSEFLRSGTIGLKTFNPGYPLATYKNIFIKSGTTTNIERILDFTTGQVLHGFINSKETGEPKCSVYVDLTHVDSSTGGYPIQKVLTDKNGEFWFGGFEPGKYYFEVEFSIKESKYIDHKEILEFMQGEKKEIVREL